MACKKMGKRLHFYPRYPNGGDEGYLEVREDGVFLENIDFQEYSRMRDVYRKQGGYEWFLVHCEDEGAFKETDFSLEANP